jgi:hypothetical protein
MLQGLKIPVHDIKVGPHKVPKTPPDYNLYVFLAIVGLHYLLIPQLVRCPEDPFIHFTPPPFYRIVVCHARRCTGWSYDCIGGGMRRLARKEPWMALSMLQWR